MSIYFKTSFIYSHPGNVLKLPVGIEYELKCLEGNQLDREHLVMQLMLQM